ncbi:EAL domain-containing protein [Sagittula sp. SSi028]|uniref:EAL domain-containing protein n=1 Tax=Sagittula sp. SSi028 TaxID=3400636 RepID=UPI003AF82BE5
MIDASNTALRDSGTILLVDDDHVALEELQDITTLEGWSSLTAASVDDALDRLADTPDINVVVTDVHFGGTDGNTANGLQLISRAQARFPDRGLSYVVLSGDPNALSSSVQTGAVDFLNKPLDGDELVAAIKAARANGGRERTVSELTAFLLSKMQKTANALKQANEDLEQFSAKEQDRKVTDNKRVKATMIRQALHNGHLLPWLQPQIDLSNGRVCGFDSVPMWIDADGATKDAGSIMAFASEAGIQAEVDGAIRSAAIRAISYFTRVGLPECAVSLHVSKDQLRKPGLVVAAVQEAVENGLAPESLCFEMPEDLDLSVSGAEHIRANLSDMPNRVLRLNMQSNGGLHGVSALKGFELDQIKLDLTGCADFANSREHQAGTRALIGLARAMGVEVIASGIKSTAEQNWLRNNGCAIGQGRHVGEPMAVDDALAWAHANLNPPLPRKA